MADLARPELARLAADLEARAAACGRSRARPARRGSAVVRRCPARARARSRRTRSRRARGAPCERRRLPSRRSIRMRNPRVPSGGLCCAKSTGAPVSVLVVALACGLRRRREVQRPVAVHLRRLEAPRRADQADVVRHERGPGRRRLLHGPGRHAPQRLPPDAVRLGGQAPGRDLRARSRRRSPRAARRSPRDGRRGRRHAHARDDLLARAGQAAAAGDGGRSRELAARSGSREGGAPCRRLPPVARRRGRRRDRIRRLERGRANGRRSPRGSSTGSRRSTSSPAARHRSPSTCRLPPRPTCRTSSGLCSRGPTRSTSWPSRSRPSCCSRTAGEDEVVPEAALRELAEAGSEPKEVRWYDAGHVPSEKMWADSRSWLSDHLGLTERLRVA